jgi:hypothetical protein
VYSIDGVSDSTVSPILLTKLPEVVEVITALSGDDLHVRRRLLPAKGGGGGPGGC